MKVHFDRIADAVYLRLDESTIIESQEVHPGIILDFNAENQVVGVEVLHVQGRLSTADVDQIDFEVA